MKLQDKRQTGWFWEVNEIFDAGLSEHALVIRLYLARCANTNGQAFPSMTTISRKCGISRATVARALKELIDTGWLEKEQRFSEENGQESSLYTLLTPKIEKGVSQGDTPVSHRHTPPSHRETPPVSQGDTEGLPIEQDLINKNIYSLFEHWNSKGIIKHKELTDRVKSHIKARMQHHSLEALMKAIDNYAIVLESDFHYWTYKWTLGDFLNPKNLERFLDENDPLNNFRKNNAPDVPRQKKKASNGYWHEW